MHVNGFIIQEYKEGTYKGIDGSGFSEKSAKNWYLNDHEMYQEQFEPFYDEYIGKNVLEFETEYMGRSLYGFRLYLSLHRGI